MGISGVGSLEKVFWISKLRKQASDAANKRYSISLDLAAITPHAQALWIAASVEGNMGSHLQKPVRSVLLAQNANLPELLLCSGIHADRNVSLSGFLRGLTCLRRRSTDLPSFSQIAHKIQKILTSQRWTEYLAINLRQFVPNLIRNRPKAISSEDWSCLCLNSRHDQAFSNVGFVNIGGSVK